jgi:ABC-type transport system involved in multi-copper enzyme maturation permease subunit
MPAKIAAIALNTFRESARDRLGMVAFFLALVMIILSGQMIEFSISNFHKMVSEFGLAFLNLGGLMVTILIGATIVSKEFQRRSIMVLFARPLSVWEFVAGKYLGFLVAVASSLFFMAVLLWGISKQIADKLAMEAPPLGWAIVFIGLELAVIAALAVFLSGLLRPPAVAMVMIAFYYLGHLAGALKEHAGKGEGGSVAAAIYSFLPNLEIFNLKSRVMYMAQEPLTNGEIAAAFAYALLLIAFFLAFAVMIVRRKEMG